MTESNTVDLQLLWVDVVVLMSSDLARYFAQDLGIESFYSDKLQKLARQFVEKGEPEKGLEWLLYRLSEKLPDEFILEVSKVSEKHDLESFLKWFHSIPSQDEYTCFWTWELSLMELVCQWDEPTLSMILPLSGVDEALLRVSVRDYLSHQDNVRKEINKVASMMDSKWDKWLVQCVYTTDPGSVVKDLFYRLYSRSFWDKLKTDLTDAQTTSLRSWIKCQGETQERFLELP